MAGKMRKKGRWGLAVILVAVLLICGFIYWKTMDMEKEVDVRGQEYQSIQNDIEKAKREQIAIKNEIRYRQTDDYVEDQARDIFGLRGSDETIFIPGDPEKNAVNQDSAETKDDAGNVTDGN
ncbi:MAG: septum formation initiator family protein [Lachnospiraceae bacterium]|nr:septum formation initiator family protein [Lachnospiraceae bacterium]MBR4345114.1 septum formation initiator family protein [Lachnospiraceae bacterium]